MNYDDPRVIRSRQLHGEALLRLATERGYENLAIQAVTDEAELGNASIHRHYRSLDELQASLIVPAWNALNRRISEQQTCHDESLALFHFVKELQDLYRIYLSLPSDHPLRQSIYQETPALFIARYERLNDNKVPFTIFWGDYAEYIGCESCIRISATVQTHGASSSLRINSGVALSLTVPKLQA